MCLAIDEISPKRFEGCGDGSEHDSFALLRVRSCSKCEASCSEHDRSCVEHKFSCVEHDRPCKNLDRSCKNLDRSCKNLDRSYKNHDCSCKKLDRSHKLLDRWTVDPDRSSFIVRLTHHLPQIFQTLPHHHCMGMLMSQKLLISF